MCITFDYGIVILMFLSELLSGIKTCPQTLHTHAPEKAIRKESLGGMYKL